MKEYKHDTQKYYEIHAVNSDTVRPIGLCRLFFSGYRQPCT